MKMNLKELFEYRGEIVVGIGNVIVFSYFVLLSGSILGLLPISLWLFAGYLPIILFLALFIYMLQYGPMVLPKRKQ